MIVPAHDPAAATGYQKFSPDIVVLDLEYSVPPKSKEAARSGLGPVINKIGDSQADAFVRIDRDTRWADARAAIHRGIKGIVFPGPEEPGEVAELAELVTAMERERGVEPGKTELVPILESAKGFWNAAAIAQASPRVTALGVIAARMLGKQPLGAFWRPGSRGGVATKAATADAAREARLMGFTGCLCATPEQVAPVNEGFAEA
jgi:citrate lyase subunit beta/citryl-CoA lyase